MNFLHTYPSILRLAHRGLIARRCQGDIVPSAILPSAVTTFAPSRCAQRGAQDTGMRGLQEKPYLTAFWGGSDYENLPNPPGS